MLVPRYVSCCFVLAYALSVGACGATQATTTPPDTTGTDDFTNRIAWSSTAAGTAEIFSMLADGTDVVNETNNAAADITPAFSNTGGRLAFASDRSGHMQIYVQGPLGDRLTRLTNSATADYSPSWSSDDSKIVFTREVTPGHTQIFVMNKDGSGQVNISNTANNDIQPSWQPGGNKIVFASDRDAKFGVNTYLEVYTMNPNGGAVTRLTFNDNGIDYFPAWSPDGRTIAFSSDRSTNVVGYLGALDIYTMTEDGLNQTNITKNGRGDVAPSFSPDGRSIVFMSDRDSPSLYAWDLYIAPATVSSTPVIRLTRSGKERTPVWHH